MTKETLNDSIKIYCTSQLKTQIKNLALINEKSISTYVVDLLEQHINGMNPRNIDSTTTDIQNTLHRLEVLSVNLFKGVYESIDKTDTFEEICANIYREEYKNEEF